jgi:excisionase family DNA binding protein
MPERDLITKSGFASLDFETGRAMLTVREVASKLRVSPQHVLDLIGEGQIKALGLGRRGRRHWRIPIESYERYLNVIGAKSFTI